MKTVVIITDTWKDQNINGVVTYLVNIQKQLEQRGVEVSIIHPGQFSHLPLPTYPEIRLSISTRNRMESMIRESGPDYIHIATEGPLGLTARMVCVKNKWPFTTYYHTRLPEYASIRFKLLGPPLTQYMRWFHKSSAAVFVGTETLQKELQTKGFTHVILSPYGVDLDLFKKNPTALAPADAHKPIFTFMGRIAPEKNIEDFLDCDLPGTKLIIGDGPAREALEKKYGEQALFVGQKTGQELVDLLSVSDVFVFPSRTDTFGLAIIEALACELPVAAYDVQGPKNIITNGHDGWVGESLKESALKCLEINRVQCRKTAEQYSWVTAAEKFIENSVEIKPAIGASSPIVG